MTTFRFNKRFECYEHYDIYIYSRTPVFGRKENNQRLNKQACHLKVLLITTFKFNRRF